MTESQRLEVIDRLYRLWYHNKDLRLGQMILNMFHPDLIDRIYYTEDFDLIRDLEDFYQQSKRRQ